MHGCDIFPSTHGDALQHQEKLLISIMMVTRWFPRKLSVAKAGVHGLMTTTEHVPYPVAANTKSLFLLSWGWTLPQIEDLILQDLLGTVAAGCWEADTAGNMACCPGNCGSDIGSAKTPVNAASLGTNTYK